MTRSRPLQVLTIVALSFATLIAKDDPPGKAGGAYQGPSSSQTPYVVPTASDWETTALLTTGDSPDNDSNYEMAGVPDGLGVLPGRPTPWGSYVDPDEYITVFMNHEFGATSGAVHAHGQTGSFVSEWTIRLDTLAVETGRDLIHNVYLWNGTAHVLSSGSSIQFSRFCSADLPRATAFFNPATGKGYPGRIFMNGEETGNEGRAFAHIVSGFEKGSSYQLPYLGRMSYENVLANGQSGDKTLVMGTDDSTPGQVYLYVGDKQQFGTPVQRAGLEGGKLYGIRVTSGGSNYPVGTVPLESKGAINGTFDLVDVSDVATGTGAILQSTSGTRGITEFARPEDGHWDTKNPNVFYVVTTGASVGGQTQTSRLYRLAFNSLSNPTSGTIEMIVDSASLTGTDGATARSFDNITVDDSGRVLVQEDPGNTSYNAKTWRVNPWVTSEVEQILESDRARFTPGAPGFLTQDEESSGVIEITDYVQKAHWSKNGHRYYLADIQSHRALPNPLVEDGQLYLIASRRLK